MSFYFIAVFIKLQNTYYIDQEITDINYARISNIGFRVSNVSCS